jgi:hypothetical protein
VATLLALLAIVLPVPTVQFFTFQAEFLSINYVGQRHEIVITRRFDPRPASWRYRQGTWIFRDEQRDLDTDNNLNSRLKLNLGLSPDWSLLAPLVLKQAYPFSLKSQISLAQQPPGGAGAVENFRYNLQT